jgi:translation initiation factor 6 (eIF-6)
MNNNFSIPTANDYITNAKDAEVEVTITLVDGTEVTGRPISVNSKGVNLKVDGKVRSFGIQRIDTMTSELDDEDDTEADRMEELANEVSDGATTAEVAALLSDYLERDLTPKELRVHLRALGLGVGKGRKYALSAGEFRAVVKVINATPVNA